MSQTDTAPVLHCTAWPEGYEFAMEVADRDEAAAVVSLFPKSAKMYATTMHTHEGGDWRNGAEITVGRVAHRSNLSANQANGGANETALRRYATIMRAADAAGIPVEYAPRWRNSYPDAEAFEAAHGLNDADMAKR